MIRPKRNDRSASAVRASSAARAACLAAADPLPLEPATRVSVAFTSAKVRSDEVVGGLAAAPAAESAAHPTPSFSWGTTPQR